jgi:hypothetical protein
MLIGCPVAAKYADPGAVCAASWAWLGRQLPLKYPFSGLLYDLDDGEPALIRHQRTPAKDPFRESGPEWTMPS